MVLGETPRSNLQSAHSQIIDLSLCKHFNMANEELIAQLIEDVQKYIIIKNNTANLDQVNTQMGIYARNPNASLPASDIEFVVALNCDIEISADFAAIAANLNKIEKIFTLKEGSPIDFSLFLKELKDNKKAISELITAQEDSVFVDLSTGQRGNLFYSYLKEQSESIHRTINATYTHYLSLTDVNQ